MARGKNAWHRRSDRAMRICGNSRSGGLLSMEQLRFSQVCAEAVSFALRIDAVLFPERAPIGSPAVLGKTLRAATSDDTNRAALPPGPVRPRRSQRFADDRSNVRGRLSPCFGSIEMQGFLRDRSARLLTLFPTIPLP